MTPEPADLLRTQPTMPPCPKCGLSSAVVRLGVRHSKNKASQRYRCNACDKIFSNEPLKHTSYLPSVILSAIIYYNLGHSLEQTAKHVKRRFRVQPSNPTILLWTRNYADICTFIPLRKKYTINPDTIIFSKKFQHQQVYDFKYHDLKLNIAGKRFPQLKAYLKALPDTISDRMFASTTRCSTFDPHLPAEQKPRFIQENNATKMALLAQTLAKTKAQRHQCVEDFFLINDSTTIATEVPVYLTVEEAKAEGISIGEPLTGHIDILQLRNDRIYIMDYKPDMDLKAAATQLQLYALSLSKRAGLPANSIVCAAFNDGGYIEF